MFILDHGYFKGLEEVIEKFLNTLSQTEMSKINRDSSTKDQKKSIKYLSQKSTCDQLNLDALYDILGHDSYTKLIIIFEKYLLYGKSVASVDLDFSQYKAFIISNKITNDSLTMKKCEIMFNQVKRENGKILI